MIFRYTEAPSVNSLLYERILWAVKVKDSQEAEKPNFRARDYTKGLYSPNPPERLRSRVDISRGEFAGRAVHILSPKGAEGAPQEGAAPLALYLHGGSYVANATYPHWRFLAGLVEKSKRRVVAPDYPLAPDYSYADAYRMLLPLYCELIAAEPRPKIILAGDSAGGGLALGLALSIRDEKIPQPEAIVMLSPWLDVTMSNPYIVEIDREDPFLNVKALVRAGVSWARGANPRKPAISPLYGNFDNLPPMHLFIGTKDVLIADCRRFRGLCLASRARLTYYEFENMIHDWMLLDFKEARMAADQIAAILAGIGGAEAAE